MASPDTVCGCEKSMTIALEPMVLAGTPDTVVKDDGWTVLLRMAPNTAHFEHTVAITVDGPLILTAL